MADPVRAAPPKRGLAAIVGVVAAAALLAFTPHNEGTVLKTYRDMGGVLTYCTGATENAQWGKTYTPDECRAQLDRDLARHAEGVVSCVHVPMSDGVAVAFVDTAYNIGVGAFCGSSMARKANAGDIRGACDSLLLWNRVGGREVRGLTVRRQAAREICLKGIV
jgi:lysozyme